MQVSCLSRSQLCLSFCRGATAHVPVQVQYSLIIALSDNVTGGRTLIQKEGLTLGCFYQPQCCLLAQQQLWTPPLTAMNKSFQCFPDKKTLCKRSCIHVSQGSKFPNPFAIPLFSIIRCTAISSLGEDAFAEGTFAAQFIWS